MKKISYDDLKKHAERLEKQNTLFNFYLYDRVNLRAPDGHAVHAENHFTATLYRCLDAHGGYLILVQIGGPTAPALHYLDDIDAKWPEPIRIIADRLRVQRQRIWDTEKQPPVAV